MIRGRRRGTPKTGGRQSGTPNRQTVEITAKLDRLGCDPIEIMATIAMDLKNSAELRGRMAAELAGYVHPKRKAIQHTHEAHHDGQYTLQELLEMWNQDRQGHAAEEAERDDRRPN